MAAAPHTSSPRDHRHRPSNHPPRQMRASQSPRPRPTTSSRHRNRAGTNSTDNNRSSPLQTSPPQNLPLSSPGRCPSSPAGSDSLDTLSSNWSYVCLDPKADPEIAYPGEPVRRFMDPFAMASILESRFGKQYCIHLCNDVFTIYAPGAILWEDVRACSI